MHLIVNALKTSDLTSSKYILPLYVVTDILAVRMQFNVKVTFCADIFLR
jgi:hypothetical protein